LGSGEPHLELAILVALWRAQGWLPPHQPDEAWLGELQLDGTFALTAHQWWPLWWGAHHLALHRLFIPQLTPSLIASLNPTKNSPQSIFLLTQAHVLLLNRFSPLELQHRPNSGPIFNQDSWQSTATQWGIIQGQLMAQRALVIAALGRHHTLLVGPPGVGKTHLVSSMAGWLPNLEPTQALAMMAVHRLRAFERSQSKVRPPIRRPHHTLNLASLLGGGVPPHPGELALAHHGLLVLDELAEFRPPVLEALRQPLEEKTLTINKGGETIRWPTDCLVVATTNPCPCGYWQHPSRGCRCHLQLRQRYWQRLSGPLLDRFDLMVHMAPIQPHLIPKQDQATAHQRLQNWFHAVQLVETLRRHPTWEYHYQAEPATLKLWQQAQETWNLSHRRHHQIWRLTQTIAVFEWAQRQLAAWPQLANRSDLLNIESYQAHFNQLLNSHTSIELTSAHLAEALSYRGVWGET
jgi:magnesium chelatase family protein